MSTNAIREFLIGLRDDEAAAHYRADPAQALAAAGLTTVTPEDIAAVAPVLAESTLVTAPATASVWAPVDMAEAFGDRGIDAPAAGADHPR
ncbi:IniB N-terminal domain-containing protein [Nocardia thraciensis]